MENMEKVENVENAEDVKNVDNTENAETKRIIACSPFSSGSIFCIIGIVDNTENAETTETRKSYRDSAIDVRIIKAVEEMGFESMTPIQEQAIPIMLEGKDLIGQAQTGTGCMPAHMIHDSSRCTYHNLHTF